MKFTLDHVLEICKVEYGLDADKSDMDFLIEQEVKEKKRDSDYDLGFCVGKFTPTEKTYRNYRLYMGFMRDLLLTYNYLRGKLPIIVGWTNNTKKIFFDDVSLAYAFKKSEMGYSGTNDLANINNRTDHKLFRLVGRIETRANTHWERKFPNWGEVIDELGSHKKVIENLGGILTYDIVKKTLSGNPYTSTRGGNRNGLEFPKEKIELIQRASEQLGDARKVAQKVGCCLCSVYKYK